MIRSNKNTIQLFDLWYERKENDLSAVIDDWKRFNRSEVNETSTFKGEMI